MIPLRDNVRNYEAPLAAWTILALNVLIFFLYGFSPAESQAQVFQDFGTIPAVVTSQEVIRQALPAWLTLFSAMFLHGDLLHLGGNMLFLYLFGDNVQERMGPFGFLWFYLLTGLIAGLAHVASAPGSEVVCVGASGAISGVLGAYVVYFRAARIRTLMLLGYMTQVFDVPAVVYLGGWFLLQLLGQATNEGEATGGVAFMAHIGGFVAGALLSLVWPTKADHPVEYEDMYLMAPDTRVPLRLELDCSGLLVLIVGIELNSNTTIAQLRAVGANCKTITIEEWSRSVLTPRPAFVVVNSVDAALSEQIRAECHQRGLLVVVPDALELAPGDAHLV